MKLLNGFLFAVIGLVFTSTAFAKSISYYDSVLTPGARLVAGDAKKGEFFIIGPREPVMRPVVHERSYTVATKQTLPHVKVAASTPVSKMAPKQPSMIAMKKTAPHARLAFNRAPSTVSKLHIANIDRALKRATLQAQKNQMAKAKPLAVVLKTAMLSKAAAALMVPHPYKSQTIRAHRANQQALKKHITKTKLALNR